MKKQITIAILSVLTAILATQAAQAQPVTPVPAGQRPAYCSPAARVSWYGCGWTPAYAEALRREGVRAVRGGHNRMGGW